MPTTPNRQLNRCIGCGAPPMGIRMCKNCYQVVMNVGTKCRDNPEHRQAVLGLLGRQWLVEALADTKNGEALGINKDLIEELASQVRAARGQVKI